MERLVEIARNGALREGRMTRRAYAVTAPRTRIIGTEDELRRLSEAGQLTFPCILKPGDGAGSAGVTVMTTPAGADAVWQATREPRGMYGTVPDPHVLVQEYIKGTEYSVESLTHNGAVSHLCITRKGVTKGAHRVETGHSLPVHLPPDTTRAIFHEAEKAIHAVGIRNGASHTELMLTPEGHCTIIEIAARLGAGHIGFLIHHGCASTAARTGTGEPAPGPRERFAAGLRLSGGAFRRTGRTWRWTTNDARDRRFGQPVISRYAAPPLKRRSHFTRGPWGSVSAGSVGEGASVAGTSDLRPWPPPPAGRLPSGLPVAVARPRRRV
ncbi:acetyl-CoA carboxylase biotin carboxylase subunit family protein [Streptomyces sp. NPDC056672]|uniref:ATP-grasp domain-containing protein n=1 Tax=Streptomyces sp. NPDC056672 TaxID=3345906 RepID=UPI0036A0DE5B